MDQERERRLKKEKLLRFYREQTLNEKNLAENEPVTVGTEDDLFNIDGSAFDARAYMDKHLREKDLCDLMIEEKVLTEQIRSLDSEMQTLMYDNYSKFISATDTIRMMKSDFKYVENEMNCLVKNMTAIGSLSDKIKDSLIGERSQLKNLVTTQQTLNKLKYLVDLPARLREYVSQTSWELAVHDLNKAKFVLKTYRNTPSFKSILEDCSTVVCDIEKKLWRQLEKAQKPNEMYFALKILRQLGFHTSRLSEAFLDLAHDRLQHCMVEVQLKLTKEEDSESEKPPAGSTDGETEEEKRGTEVSFLRFDVLHFSNLITDSLLDELNSYVSSYTSLFSSSLDESDSPDTIISVIGGVEDAGSKDLEPVELENHLLDLVEEIMNDFFKLIEERFTEDEQSRSDTALLVRALDRIHGRVQGFTRSLADAVGSMGSISPELWDMEQTNEEEAATHKPAFGQRVVKVCNNLMHRALDLVIHMSQSRATFYLRTLCHDTVDCITDLREQLVGPGASVNSGALEKRQLVTLFDNLNTSLVTQIRDVLKSEEIFLNAENTFVNRPNFREQFCLVHIRERLVVGYLKYLLKFLDDLAKTAAGRIPSPILLLLAKLCLTWANSGTIGHFLSMADEMLSSTSKIWPRGSISKTLPDFGSSDLYPSTHLRLGSFSCFSAPTTPKDLADHFREVGTCLLVTYVRLEGTNLAQLFRKSVEARDWLKGLEPRSVRSVAKRVIEDLTSLDSQIAQLLPSNARAKDRGSDSRSARSGVASLRPSGSSHFLENCQPGAGSGSMNSVELDPALATQLRRLFTQRVDIFAPVEPNRESLLLGMIKIGLKTLVECVRLQTFGKFGLQQIQVDCRYLQIHLWHFVNDEKLIGSLLDDVVYSVVQRCVDPQLMDDSIVDAICDRT
ncbi:unnamed protein product [Calicophoron daubneyi]|uniref:Vacuolar protein sorting-associated protein 51 homolog n=1 Tax=Calicophoron daubneyi TaxID=300641 RepID=A0AAV2TJG6_CALDB